MRLSVNNMDVQGVKISFVSVLGKFLGKLKNHLFINFRIV